jgi:(p)ppGpp synthase/HD superfamily hydrolase
MRERGYKDDDLKRTRDAYELAMQVFTGHFRPNNKSFLAHLCGVASILVAHQEKSDIVIAGLLHSIYSHGDFGNGKRGVDRVKRAKVKGVIGEAVEQLINNYRQSR